MYLSIGINSRVVCVFFHCVTNYILLLFDNFASPEKNDGNFSESLFIASSMVMASPTYDAEPLSGKAAVGTGALAIRNRMSAFLVLPWGNT